MHHRFLDQVNRYLATYRPQTVQQSYLGIGGIQRVSYCMDLLGHPQDQYQVIHVAGTSGKGSTCKYIAHGLQSQGYKVGLTLSPHLIDVTERFVIDNQQISAESLRDLIQSIDPYIQQTNAHFDQNLSYFEICMMCAYTRFARSGVDIAVIETGLGGLYDASNIVTHPDKIAVLTDMGLDHTDILGPTLTDIVYQKAMITHPGQHVFAHHQSPEIDQMIIQTVAQQKGILHHLDYETLTQIDTIGHQTTFRYHDGEWHEVTICGGSYQVRNAHLALQVIKRFQQQHRRQIDYHSLHQTFLQTHTIARHMSIHIGHHMVLLDGAHNPHKMSAYLEYLASLYPQGCHYIIAFKQGKDRKQMIDSILVQAQSVAFLHIPSVSHDLHAHFVDPIELMQYTIQQGYNPDAVRTITTQEIDMYVDNHPGQHVITGSLYMIGYILQMYQKSSLTL